MADETGEAKSTTDAPAAEAFAYIACAASVQAACSTSVFSFSSATSAVSSTARSSMTRPSTVEARAGSSESRCSCSDFSVW